MKVTLNNVALQSIEDRLSDINQNIKNPNEFVMLQNTGDSIDIKLVANKEQVLSLPISEFGNIFDYRDNYIGKFNFDKKELNVFTFVDLHTHTEYSILDGANRIKDLSKKYGYAGAITDHGVMYGCVDFYKTMKDLHKKPILGFEAYMTSYKAYAHLNNSNLSNDEKLALEKEEKNVKHHLIILVKNEVGYQNAMALCSYGQSHQGGRFPLRPRVSYEELIAHKDGLIILSACIAGEIPQRIIKGDITAAREQIEFFKKEFGDDFYLEIQKHASEQKVQDEMYELQSKLGTISMSEVLNDFNLVQKGDLSRKDFISKYSKKLYREVELSISEELVNDTIMDLADEYNVKVVATTDAHYLNEEDADFHEALLCNQTKTTLSNPDHFSFAGEGYYVHTNEEMEKLYYDMPEVLINTLEVTDKCNFDFKFGEYKLPNFPIPSGYTDKTYLRKLAEDGFNERFANLDPNKLVEYKERFEFELETIFKMGYQGYFFIVWDYIRYAKENGIYVGPGRGSGAGSIILYCLHITENLDPIQYDLLFERFLNPDRISMPKQLLGI